ncbi:MAG: hypothetical protein WD872_16195, partial [Pirellulaceae bacterium]
RFAGSPPASATPNSANPAIEQPVPPVVEPPSAPADETKPAKRPAFSPQRHWKGLSLAALSIVAGGALAIAAVAAISAVRSDSKPAAVVPKPAAKSAPANEKVPVEPKQPGDTPPEQIVPPEQATATKSPKDSSDAVAVAPAPPPPGDGDPLGLVQPEGLPGAAANEPGKTNPLAQFDQILSGATEDPLARPADAAPRLPTPDESTPDESTSAEPPRPELPRPPPRAVDVAARLADPLAGIETAGTPLADFLQVLSDLSTLPITLEPDALPLAQANAASPVHVKLTNTTTGQALAAALASLGLEYVVEGDQLVARLIEPTPLRTQVYPLQDLSGGDEEEAADLAETIKALVDPRGWGEDESAGAMTVTKDALTIRQRRAVHARLFVLCEKLRTARKLPYASRFDPALFALDTRSQRAAARLAAPLTLNYSQPTPLVQILPRLEEATGMKILVDWRDIAAAGWNPDGEATLVADNQPLSAALTALLEPMDLAWRIVDGQTLQVVTRETLLALPELEFYRVDDLLAGDQTGESLVAKARQALGADLFLDRGGPFEIRFDEPSQCLLAALPQPKQQELAALLVALRSAAK